MDIQLNQNMEKCTNPMLPYLHRISLLPSSSPIKNFVKEMATRQQNMSVVGEFASDIWQVFSPVPQA